MVAGIHFKRKTATEIYNKKKATLKDFKKKKKKKSTYDFFFIQQKKKKTF